MKGKSKSIGLILIGFLSIGMFTESLFSNEERKLSFSEADSITGYGACEECGPPQGKCCSKPPRACKGLTPINCKGVKRKIGSNGILKKCKGPASGSCTEKKCGKFSEWQCANRRHKGRLMCHARGTANPNNVECAEACL